jgi:hypothetical protein
VRVFNGWVMGGLGSGPERQTSEKYVERPFYERLFKELARIVSIQQADDLAR